MPGCLTIRRLAGPFAILVWLAACGDSGQAVPAEAEINRDAHELVEVEVTTGPEEPETHVVRQPRGCDATPGEATHIPSEPATWLVNWTTHRWSNSEGCPIRLDVILHSPGSDHCDRQTVEFITIGATLGESILEDGTISKNSRRFYWDPEDVLKRTGRGETRSVADLAGDAVDTGMRHDGRELWLSSTEPAELFVVSGDEAQIWERQIEPVVCF